MSPRQIVILCTVLAATPALTGCGLQYNGSFGATMDATARRQYDEFMRKQHELALAKRGNPFGATASHVCAADHPHQQQQITAASDNNRHGPKPVSFSMPDPDDQSALIVESQPFDSGNRARFATNRADNVSIGALGLYGQLPQARPGQSSPLDSPDNLRQISFATEGADFDPDVDPTGTLLAYASTQHRATADLYLKRINGTALQQLTNDPANDVMPTFSPDGRKVAFASDRAGNWDIYMMDITGGQAVQLTSDQTHDISPSFSPDGRQLVYCTYGAQSGQWELVVIDVENPATKRFIGYGLFPDWSPVDNRILFQRARERGTRWFSLWSVEMVNGEGVRPTELVASSNAAAISPTWSPNGKHIAFSTIIDPESEQQTRPVQADIWVLNADGSGRANLTNSQFADLHPAWAKDGSIFFVSNRAKNGVENIWAIRPDRALRVSEPMANRHGSSALAAPRRMDGRLKELASDPDAMIPTQ